MQQTVFSPPPPAVPPSIGPRNDGGLITETRYFATIEEATAAKFAFLNRFGCPGYDGTCNLTPPNHDRPYATLYTSRWHSCD